MFSERIEKLKEIKRDGRVVVLYGKEGMLVDGGRSTNVNEIIDYLIQAVDRTKMEDQTKEIF